VPSGGKGTVTHATIILSAMSGSSVAAQYYSKGFNGKVLSPYGTHARYVLGYVQNEFTVDWDMNNITRLAKAAKQGNLRCDNADKA
jgi:hypothetical protein